MLGVSGSKIATASGSVTALSHLIALKPKPTTTTQRYSHTAGGDSPDVVLNTANTVIEYTIGLPGGVMFQERGATDTWSYPNVHGDVMTTADHTGAKTGSYRYDPNGKTLTSGVDNQAGNMDYGWLGQTPTRTRTRPRPQYHRDGRTPVCALTRSLPRGRPHRGWDHDERLCVCP